MIENIRNFSIVAHIDHGKSTLADRLLEITHTIEKNQMREQVLDSMALERERGITIKSHPVRMKYLAKDGQTYILNLIDTTGHVDFMYEVSRSLAATEGIILLVDASQGVEAQTVAHAYAAINMNKIIIPVINKIDLASIDLDMAKRQIKEIIGIETHDVILASGKEGTGVEDILEAIVKRIPAPTGQQNKPFRALIFDSWFDSYRGIVVYIRVVDGQIKPGVDIKLMSNNKVYTVKEVGSLCLGLHSRDCLMTGEVGYLTASIKELADTKIGDTVTTVYCPAETPLPGYKEPQPMVFCSLYPGINSSYQELGIAIQKLSLNDASFVYESESSSALGFGYRCGFLGLLHLDIIQERLKREYGLDLISTAPSVPYIIHKKNGQVLHVDNPVNYPDPGEIIHAEEPYIKAIIYLPSEYVGGVMELVQSRRAVQKDAHYLEGNRVVLTYEIPLSEVLTDFYDKLKSVSRGYASFDYEHTGYKPTKITKVDIMVAGDIVDALSFLTYHERAYSRGRDLVIRLKEVIPKQQFAIALQAAIGGKIIARETIPAFKKDVTAKCYGGDITRKRKLWDKQKEGKKKMRQMGSVDIPNEAFKAILSVE
ncbi:elongation factor 4 [Candidatus Desantisbacteria bacterium]|nr:elongation factor 4 [Candidatus Desantisbacteria bacterium]